MRRAILLPALLPVVTLALACSSDGEGTATASGSGGDDVTSAGGASGTGGASSSDGGASSSLTGTGAGSGDGGAAATTTTTSATASSTSAGGGGPCPDGVTCVDTFPFGDDRDTSTEGQIAIASYACSPDTNEGGPEIVYRAWAPTDGFLSAAVHVPEGVDIDVQILTDYDPANPSGAGCVARGDKHARADVTAGPVWVVADTWVNGSGVELTGSFHIDIGFIGPSEGPCSMLTGTMDRVNDDEPLAMPATGPIVLEAHLVTQEEPAPYPSTATEELAEHHALSQARTGLVMFRSESWAPLEGGSFYGAGIGDPADLPVLDEGWYVNMYWTPAARPPRGTKMILRLPDDPSRAVVVAAGYETGPGNLSNVAGTPEETHFYLGTQHQAPMTIGIATDQSLPFGPRRCN
jgi:hypothetical protein